MSAPDNDPIAVSPDSDQPVMTPGLAKVFASIFQRLLSEDAARSESDTAA
jgi:hypothetical protein